MKPLSKTEIKTSLVELFWHQAAFHHHLFLLVLSLLISAFVWLKEGLSSISIKKVALTKPRLPWYQDEPTSTVHEEQPKPIVEVRNAYVYSTNAVQDLLDGDEGDTLSKEDLFPNDTDVGPSLEVDLSDAEVTLYYDPQDLLAWANRINGFNDGPNLDEAEQEQLKSLLAEENTPIDPGLKLYDDDEDEVITPSIISLPFTFANAINVTIANWEFLAKVVVAGKKKVQLTEADLRFIASKLGIKTSARSINGFVKVIRQEVLV